MKWLTLVVFFIPALVFSQSELTGSVTDENGEFLPGVTVQIEGTDKGTATDLEGRFNLGRQPEGQYRLLFKFVGYKDEAATVKHPSGSRQVIKMTPAVTELNMVVVSADREALKRKTEGYHVSVISAEQFHDFNMDANAILGTISGVNIREKGGLGSGFELSLNGLSGSQVRYFIDGVPMEFYGSALTLNNFPSNMIRRMEVYKGVTPVELTSDALGGTVNIVTPDLNDKFLDVSYTVGSFNTHRASVIAQHSTNNGLSFRLMTFFNHSDNNYYMDHVPRTDNFGNVLGYQRTRRFHDAYTGGSVIATVGISDKPFADLLAVEFTYAGNQNEIQHTSVSINRVYGGLTSVNETMLASVRHEKKLGDLSWKNNLMLGQVSETYYDTLMQRFDWQGDSKVINTAEHYSAPSTPEVKDQFLWFRTSAKYQISKGHELVGQVSMNYMRRDGGDETNPRLEALFTPNYLNKNFAGLSYNYQSDDDHWKLSVFLKQYWYSAEIHSDEYTNEGTEVVKTETSLARTGYGTALSYLLQKSWRIKASYEFAYRLPEAREIMGDGLLVLPSPSLKPENSHNVNLGLQYSSSVPWGSVKSELSGFYRPMRDKIWQVAQGVLSTYQNVQDTRIIGIESSSNINIKNQYSVTLNATYQSNTDQRKYNEGLLNANYGERMPNDPYLFSDLGLAYKLNIGNAQFSPMWNTRYVHRFFLYSEGNDVSDKKSIPTQLINDLSINCKMAQGKYNVSFSVNNIFDKEAYDNWSLQKPGRAYYVKVRCFLNGN